MATLSRKIYVQFLEWKKSGTLTVVYALFVEILFLGYLAFIGLFTIETVLPTFIIARLSLTKYFFLLFLLTLLTAWLGRKLALAFPIQLDKKNPVLWLGGIWLTLILGVSLYKFPPIFLVIILLGFLLIAKLFWQVLFEE